MGTECVQDKPDKTDSNRRRQSSAIRYRFVPVQKCLTDFPNVKKHGMDTLNANRMTKWILMDLTGLCSVSIRFANTVRCDKGLKPFCLAL